MTALFMLFIAFAFGSVIGSFLNVCIYRIPLGFLCSFAVDGQPFNG